MASNVNFVTEIPDLGDGIVIIESTREAAAKLRTARANDLPTVTFTAVSNKQVVIPIHLIGPIVER